MSAKSRNDRLCGRRTPASRTGLSAAACLTVILALAGCSKADPKPTNASTTASTAAATSTAASGSTSGASTSPSASVSTAPVTFDGTCEDLLPVSTVEDAANAALVGRTSFVVGIPETSIHRLAYLNCKYGITSKKVNKKTVTTTLVEIGISLYETPQQATDRVTGTVDAYRAAGASESDATVGGVPATILLGSGNPTLVVAAGRRTVAVTVAATFVAPAKRSAALSGIANAALKATAGSAGASASASASASSS